MNWARLHNEKKVSIPDKNGCLRWSGGRNVRNVCQCRHKNKTIIVLTFLWKHHYPDIEISRSEYLQRTCNTYLCVNIEHIVKVPRKQESSKQDVWYRLLERGSRQENNCLLWTGCKSNDYGISSVNGKSYKVHRISLWIHNDYKSITDIPMYNEENQTLVVRHICNNPLCFEPSHLQLGTEIENSMDKKENGTTIQAERHPKSTISEDLARKIKHSLLNSNDANYMTITERAVKFKVDKTIIENIDKGYAWAHIPDINGKYIDISSLRSRQRQTKKNASNRVWTEDMWEKAKVKIMNNINISDSIRTPFVTTSCYEWLGGTNDSGYGMTSCYGKQMRVHILSCEIKYKKHRPKELVTRHLCGNKICCNPDHLEFGTRSENAIDNVYHGTSNAKLTPEIIKEIRETRGKDGLSQKERAKKYGIKSTEHLREIEIRKRWKHVD
jgi:ribosome-binding protein aMBF1 (putative translation factor)